MPFLLFISKDKCDYKEIIKKKINNIKKNIAFYPSISYKILRKWLDEEI